MADVDEILSQYLISLVLFSLYCMSAYARRLTSEQFGSLRDRPSNLMRPLAVRALRIAFGFIRRKTSKKNRKLIILLRSC